MTHLRRALVLMLPVAIAACTGTPSNRTLYSVHQPVVDRSTVTLDLAGDAAGGVRAGEQQRLADWLDVLGARPGDRIAVSGGGHALAPLLAARGLLPGDPAEAPPSPGMVRIALTRSRASVPGCPDWADTHSAQSDNRTANNYGCAINANLAAMVADPEHLLHGATDTGRTTVMTSNRAIETWRDRIPTGAEDLPQVNSASGAGSSGGSN